MSLFRAYTGRFNALTPWEQRHLSGLGESGVVDARAAAEWVAAEQRWQLRNDHNIRDFDSAINGPTVRWLGTMIAPKPDPWGRHLLVDVYATVARDVVSGRAGFDVDGRPITPGMILLVQAGSGSDTEVGKALGLGYFDNMYSFNDPASGPGAPGKRAWDGDYQLASANARGWSRTHTPNGVAHKGGGLGSILYAGLALAAIDAGFKGNYSIETTRSNSASTLWKSGRSPRSGPLVSREYLPMQLNADGTMNANYSGRFGSSYHCPDDLLSVVPDRGYACADPQYIEPVGTIGVDYIDAAGLKRWGLLAFHAPLINGKGLRSSYKPTRDPATGVVTPPPLADDPYTIRSRWKNDDVKRAFGMRVAPSTLTSQAAAMQRHSHMLSPAGAEMLALAAVGPSVALIVELAAVLQGRSNDLAVAFLRREDIANVLAKTGAGKAILTSMGVGTPLQGLGRAAFRDVIAAAGASMTNPTQLTLPKLSRSTQSFINSYPDES